MPLNNQLIPVRFIMTISHFIIMLMMYVGRVDNIKAQVGSIYTHNEYDSWDQSVKGATALSIMCFMITIPSLMAGITMFFPTLNAARLHFGGVVTFSKYITDEWGASNVWWIFCSFNLIPTLLEIAAIASVFVFRVHKF